MKSSAGFVHWKNQVNAAFMLHHCIDLGMSGIDDDFMAPHYFEMDQTAEDFVQWFGEKYDLDHADDSRNLDFAKPPV